MGHNKPFGSPEIEESLPTKLVGKAGEGAHEAISSLWDQMLGVGDYKASSHDASPPPYDAKSAHSPHDVPPSYEASQAKHASEGSETKKVIEGVLFQLGLHNQEKHQQNPENHAESRHAGIDYAREVIDSGKNAQSREQNELNRKIKEITDELVRLISTTKELKNHFGTVAVESPPQKPGKYHENFFDWLLIMIKQARQKVENSSSWLGTIKGKGKGKGDYWDRAEKEGTTFSQSMDRSASTSVG